MFKLCIGWYIINWL